MQDLLVVLLHERLGQVVLLGEEAVELAGFSDQLPLDVVDHARDYTIPNILLVGNHYLIHSERSSVAWGDAVQCDATYRPIL